MPTVLGAQTHREIAGPRDWASVASFGALLRRWAPRSLRVRLVIIVVTIDCIAALLTGAVIVWKARTAERLEIASAMQLAETLVGDTIRLMQNAPAPIVLQSVDLHFQSIRHVRVAVLDDAGRPVGKPTEPQAARNDAVRNDAVRNDAGRAEAAPAWFSWLIGAAAEKKDFPIIVRHTRIGVVRITSEPADEIGEAWDYAHTLLVTGACLNLIVLAVLFLAFGRVLSPLTGLASALRDLEDKNYAVRLPQPSVAELSTITEHFNKTAGALSAAQDANRQLNRRIVAAQDEERRRTALELHDEVGPCLFALEATASSVKILSKKSPELARIHERAIELVALVEKVQGINRRVLDRLRPMALGEIPLRDRLIQLIVEFGSSESGPEIDHRIGTIRDSYGFLVDLTVYRCVQEGLFNAVRHADADGIRLSIEEGDGKAGRHIVMRIADDGHGFAQPARVGIGLPGMRERVEALSGTFDVKSSSSGTILDITIPIDQAGTPNPPAPTIQGRA